MDQTWREDLERRVRQHTTVAGLAVVVITAKELGAILEEIDRLTRHVQAALTRKL